MNQEPKDPYIPVFELAQKQGKSFSVIKKGVLSEIQDHTIEIMKSLGYLHLLDSSGEYHAYVYAKDPRFVEMSLAGSAMSYKILIKFTDLADGTIRVDAMRYTDMMYIRENVDKDLKVFKELIKEE